jgi:hypothetical protein
MPTVSLRRRAQHGPRCHARNPSIPVAKDRLLERLRDVHAEGADIWIHGRNRDLGGEEPIDLLATGQFERVLATAERLSAGAT